MKKKIILGAVLLLIILVANIAYNKYNFWINNELAYSAICPTKVDSIQRIATIKKSEIHFDRFQSVCTYSNEGLLLKGFFIKAKCDTAKGTVILIHGIASCKESMMGTAETLSNSGFNCALFDQRAHGESAGKYCTFGYYEKYDIISIISFLRKEFIGIGKVGLYGHSMGGAVVIQTMAIDSSIVCGVAASPFANMRGIVRDFSAHELGIRLNFIADDALKISEKIAKFTVDSVSPENSAKDIVKPLYIIHGKKDPKIPYTDAIKIFNALKIKQKKLFIIENAHHEDLQQVAGSFYIDSIIKFFDDYLK